MEFFKAFGQLAKTVEKDVADIQQQMASAASNPHTNEEDKEQCIGSAILVARDLQNNVKEIKKEMRECKKSLNNDSGFVELVEISQALVKKQAEIITQIEQHIQQYGYQPLHIDKPSSQQTANSSVESKAPAGLDVEGDENDSINSAHGEEEKSDADVHTPEKKSSSSNTDVVKTPKLEDFGLSKDILNYYKTLGENMRKQMNAGGTNLSTDFKEPLPVSSSSVSLNSTDNISTQYCNKTPMKKTDQLDETYAAIPDYFNHAGLVPTPGFTGGRDRTNSQDDSLPSETPLSLKSRSLTKPCDKLQKYANQDRDSFDLPSPPILNTPGIKQIARYDRNKTDPVPSFNLSEIDGTDSPIPPVLQTPGIKQLPRTVDLQLQKQSPCKMKLDLNVADEETPSPPVMFTPGVRQIRKYWGKDKPDLSKTVAYDSDDGIPEMPELTFSWTDLQKIKSQYEQVQETSTSNHDVEKSSYSVVQKSSYNDKENGTVPGIHIKVKQERNVEDSPIPTMPELTGTYNFLQHQSAPTSMQETYKENIAPNPIESNDKGVEKRQFRLQNITQDEYDNQPDYVHRLLSLTLLNKTVNIMEKLFSQKFSEGKLVCVTQNDLQPLLGPTTKSLLLVMVRLGRLKESYNIGHELSYVPV